MFAKLFFRINKIFILIIYNHPKQSKQKLKNMRIVLNLESKAIYIDGVKQCNFHQKFHKIKNTIPIITIKVIKFVKMYIKIDSNKIYCQIIEISYFKC